MIYGIAITVWFFPTDLPYLICRTHKLKKQIVEFVEASVVQEDDEFVQCSLPAQQNLHTFSEPQALKLALEVQMKEDLFKESVFYLFSNTPYFLKPDKFQMQDNEAYITFSEDEGTTQGCPLIVIFMIINCQFM